MYVMPSVSQEAQTAGQHSHTSWTQREVEDKESRPCGWEHSVSAEHAVIVHTHTHTQEGGGGEGGGGEKKYNRIRGGCSNVHMDLQSWARQYTMLIQLQLFYKFHKLYIVC